MNFIKIRHWNANGVSQHKNEILYFMQTNDIDALLHSETHLTYKNNFKISGFNFYGTNHPDGKAHGGTGILIRNSIKHESREAYSKDFLQATSVTLQCWGEDITLSALYCPPRFAVTQSNFIEYFETLGEKFLAAGDYNAKHTHWGSRLINPKGR